MNKANFNTVLYQETVSPKLFKVHFDMFASRLNSTVCSHGDLQYRQNINSIFNNDKTIL